jgi:hypothetical protein
MSPSIPLGCTSRFIELFLPAARNDYFRALSRKVANPMPLLPPVISAIFPDNFAMSLLA